MSVVWEAIETIPAAGVKPATWSTLDRSAVPGGWLYRYREHDGYGLAVAIAFVPDDSTPRSVSVLNTPLSVSVT